MATHTAIPPKLAQALYECQVEVESVLKDSTNPHFRSKYATINSVIDALKPALKVSSLFVSQPLIPSEKDGYVTIRTIISHASGEAMTFLSEMKVEGSTPQKMISALTYLRRAVLVSTFMLEQEDDDGNHASTPPPKVEPITQNTTNRRELVDKTINAAVDMGWTKTDLLKLLNQEFKKVSFELLTEAELERVYKGVSNLKPKDILK